MAEFDPAVQSKRPVTDPNPQYTFGTVQVGTFADDPPQNLDNVMFGRPEAGAMFAEEEAPVEEVPEAESAPEPAPVPASATPQDTAAAVAAALRAVRDEEFRSRQAQEAARQAAQAWEPPQIPDDVEEMLADPAKTREVLVGLREHARGIGAAVMAQVAPLHNEINTLRIKEAKRSWTEARRTLIREGMPAAEADAMAGKIEGALQQINDPGVYWQVWTDPERLVQASKMIQAQSPKSGRRPASIGVSGGGQGDSFASGPKHPAIARVEAMLGTKLSKDRVQSFMRESGGGR